MDWPNEVVFEFLDCYKNEPVIWNASIPNHRNRSEVYDAWKRIERNMDRKYTVTELKKKKESLMATFRSYFNKVKQSTRSAAVAENVYKPQWFAYEKIASILRDKDPLIISEPNATNAENPDSLLSCDKDDEEDDLVIRNSKTGGLEQDDVQNEERPLSTWSKFVFKSPQRKRKKISEADDIKHNMNNDYPILQAAVQKPSEGKNVCTLYGELVAAKLRAMDERTRDMCMNRIDNIMFEMKMNAMAQPENYHLFHMQQCPQSSPSSASQSSMRPDQSFFRSLQSPSPN